MQFYLAEFCPVMAEYIQHILLSQVNHLLIALRWEILLAALLMLH